MKPVERVLTAISHKEPDRVPIILGASNATGIKIEAFNRFRNHRGLGAVEDDSPKNYLYFWRGLGTALPDEP